MDDEKYIEQAENEIKKWESEGPGYISQVGDMILWPAQKAADFLIPESVQEAVSGSIELFLAGLDRTANALINVDDIRTRAAGEPDGHDSELARADSAARHYWNWNLGIAATEGGATGALGLVGLVADIPALMTIAFRIIQQIGTCYGYDVTTEAERAYVLHILRTGSTGDLKAKMEFLIGLKQIEQILLKVTWRRMGEAWAQKELSALAALGAARNFAKSLGLQVTKRKSLQMVPVVGALVGASFNATFINDIGRAAYMSFRRRWIAEQFGDGGEPGGGGGSSAR
ncbi:MAG: EcsC family protein [Planctomycetota bacterium]|nr:EcsC family protein [Planctomycetota bacterium]